MSEGRYREAERRLWDDAGAAPVEHRLHLARNDAAVRLLEVGEGPPVLFLHGGPGAAGAVFAHLAACLTDFRCLLLDRPGTGLSDPAPLADAEAVRRECETLVVDVLDALGLDRTHLVGSSHGSYIALLTAVAHPDRVGRTVHFGCPAFVEGMALTAFDRMGLVPGARHLFGLVPASEKSVRSALRQMGHEAALAAGSIPQAALDWSVAVQRDTDTMRNELASMANMGTFRRGFHPSLHAGPDLLAQVRSPSYFLWGDNDPYGGEPVARATVGAMPDAQLEMLPGGGHLTWVDDLDHAAAVVRRHLSGP